MKVIKKTVQWVGSLRLMLLVGLSVGIFTATDLAIPALGGDDDNDRGTESSHDDDDDDDDDDEASRWVLTGNKKKGRRVFNKCKACHQVGKKAKNKVGPELNGIFGRSSGSVANFKYSKAMSELDMVWDPKNLSEFLSKPKKFIKGTKMSFAGLRKEKDINNLLAYLVQFDSNGKKRDD